MNIKKLFSGLGRDVLLLFVIGGVLLYQTAGDFLVSVKPAVSFEDMLNGTEVKPGTHVAGDVVYAFDYFATESSYTQRSDGSRSGSRKTGNYYLIPIADGYIGLKSRQADVAALDKLSEETFTFLQTGAEPATTIFMEGNVEVLEGKLATYYQEYLEELGYSKAEIEAFGTPLVVRYVSFNAVRVMFLIGIVFIILGIVIMIRRANYVSGLPKASDLPNSPI